MKTDISLKYITRFLKGPQKTFWKKTENKQKAWIKILHKRIKKKQKEQNKDVWLNLDKK